MAAPTTITSPATLSPATSTFGQGVAADLNFLISPDRCGLLHSTTQSIANNTFTAHLFDTESAPAFDSNNMHSTSSNTSRITIVTAGMYLLSGVAAFAGNATGRRGGAFYKNGSIINGSEWLTPASVATALAVSSPAFLVPSLVAGDYLELYVYQDSGGALNANPGSGAASSFQAIWVATS